MLTAALPFGSVKVEFEIDVNELSLLIDSPVMLLETPYMKANGVTVVPPDPSLVLPEPVPLPQELTSISSTIIASRRLDLFIKIFSMRFVLPLGLSHPCGTVYIFALLEQLCKRKGRIAIYKRVSHNVNCKSIDPQELAGEFPQALHIFSCKNPEFLNIIPSPALLGSSW
jgi:hypothetical protein